MLRVAVAGAGMVSAHHLRAWATIPDCTVVAIADPDLARAERRCAEFGIDHATDDAERMLDTFHPDVLDVAAGHSAHRALCMAAARRGIAVLCQKPLAPTLEEARQLATAVDGRVRMMVNENWRFRPWYRQVIKWLAEHAIGAPRMLTLDARSSGFVPRNGQRPALTRQPMLGDLRRLLIGEVLVHHLDVAACLLGPLRVERASITHGAVAIRGETMATMDLAGIECRASVSGNLLVPDAPAGIVDALALDGDDGSITLEGPVLTLAGRHSTRIEYSLDAGYQASYDDAIAHFAAALRNGAPFATPPEVHLRVLELVEDAYALAARG